MNWLSSITKVIAPWSDIKICSTIAPWLGYALVSGGLSGLAGYLGAEVERKRGESEREYAERIAKERRGRAREIIGDEGAYTPYGVAYEPYVSPLEEPTRATLAQYLRGELTPGQQAVLAQQRRLGEAGIARTAAGARLPGGAMAALSTQLARDIALRGVGLAGEQQRFGVQAALPYAAAGREEARYGYETGLAAYLRGEQAKARRRELELQYLT